MSYQKLIYIPSGNEAGMHKGYPAIIYVKESKTIDNNLIWKGCLRLLDLEDGRFGWYKDSHCYPFSPEIWDKCLWYIDQRNQLEDDYDQILKGARNKKKRFPEI